MRTTLVTSFTLRALSVLGLSLLFVFSGALLTHAGDDGNPCDSSDPVVAASCQGQNEGGGTPDPTITSFTASPNPTNPGQGTTLTWATANAFSCSSNDFTVPPFPNTSIGENNGSTAVYPSVTTTYTITCNATGTSATASASVTVNVTPNPPTGLAATCSADGTHINLSWNASAGADGYYYRIYDTAAPMDSRCTSYGWQIYGPDNHLCLPNPDTQEPPTSITNFPIVVGHAYSWWIHSSSNAAGVNPNPTSSSFTCNGLPDLTAGATSYTGVYGQQWAEVGVPITYSATVSNIGTAASGSFQNALWVDGVQLSGLNALSLAPSSSGTASGNYTFGSTGTYNVRTCADMNTSGVGSVSESNEGNNCGAFTSVPVVAAPPSGLAYSCNANGTAVTLSWSNTGADSYYVRVSSAGQTCPAGWQSAGDNATCIPNPDAYYSTSVTYTTVPGTNYGWWVHSRDSSGRYSDATSGPSFTCNGAPDLTASVIGAITPSLNTPATLTATVSNIGNATATNFPNSFNVYDDNTTSSILVAAQNLTLGPSGSSGVSASYSFPTTDSYEVRACADMNTSWAGTVTESNESNNCSGWTHVSVGAADYTATNLFPPSGTSYTSGSSIPFQGRVNNVGTADSGSTVQNILQVCSASGPCSSYNQYLPVTTSAQVPASGNQTVNISGTAPSPGSYVYRLCVNVNSTFTANPLPESNYGNNCEAWVSITSLNPTPTSSLTPSPSSIASGGSSTLTWSSANTTSCTGTGFSTGNATSGSVSVGPLFTTSNYQLTCTGAGGSTNAFATVNVQTPTVSVSIAPLRVASGGSATLTWSSSNAASCTVTGPNLTAPTPPALSGSQSVTVTGQQTYTATCGGASASATVNVPVRILEF